MARPAATRRLSDLAPLDVMDARHVTSGTADDEAVPRESLDRQAARIGPFFPGAFVFKPSGWHHLRFDVGQQTVKDVEGGLQVIGHHLARVLEAGPHYVENPGKPAQAPDESP